MYNDVLAAALATARRIFAAAVRPRSLGSPVAEGGLEVVAEGAADARNFESGASVQDVYPDLQQHQRAVPLEAGEPTSRSEISNAIDTMRYLFKRSPSERNSII